MASSLQGCDRPPGFSELAFEATTPPTHLGCFSDDFEGTVLIETKTSGGDSGSKCKLAIFLNVSTFLISKKKKKKRQLCQGPPLLSLRLPARLLLRRQSPEAF